MRFKAHYHLNYFMKNLENYIQEKFLIDNDMQTYTCHPKDKFELREILEKRLAKDKDADLNDIDVSQITDMGMFDNYKGLFGSLDPHNIDISNWDVSKVKDTSFIFCGCENFNANLSNWDVSNVIEMAFMFHNCKNFTGKGLENWNVNKVIDMDFMFDDCTSLKNKPSWYKG